MENALQVSIIINNYNYGRFLQEAIDSSLYQSYSHTEVIVVDDGSTDNSCQIIANYGNQIIPVYKENGGQASAFNAGFAHSHGEVVIFLDADDMLFPHIAEHVAAVFRANPRVAKVQYRLEVIDAGGTRSGLVKPTWNRPMPQGDLRAQVLLFPDDILWQPTSGNAFRASVLQQIFPVPEEVYRLCADYYLSNLPPLFGTVFSIEELGGAYRVHGANNHNTSRIDVEQSRQIIIRTCHTHRYIGETANSLGLKGFPPEAQDVLSVTFLAQRMISLKLDPQLHPIRDDRLVPLVARGIHAALQRFDLPWYAKVLYAAWFIAVALAPQPLARWLAQKFFYPETRGQFNIVTRIFRARA